MRKRRLNRSLRSQAPRSLLAFRSAQMRRTRTVRAPRRYRQGYKEEAPPEAPALHASSRPTEYPMRCKRTVRRPTRWTPDEWRRVEAAAEARNVPSARFEGSLTPTADTLAFRGWTGECRKWHTGRDLAGVAALACPARFNPPRGFWGRCEPERAEGASARSQRTATEPSLAIWRAPRGTGSRRPVCARRRMWCGIVDQPCHSRASRP
jgi:hypothetical protein